MRSGLCNKSVFIFVNYASKKLISSFFLSLISLMCHEEQNAAFNFHIIFHFCFPFPFMSKIPFSFLYYMLEAEQCILSRERGRKLERKSIETLNLRSNNKRILWCNQFDCWNGMDAKIMENALWWERSRQMANHLTLHFYRCTGHFVRLSFNIYWLSPFDWSI